MGLSRESTVIWVCMLLLFIFIHLVNEDRQILNSVSQRKRRWIGHVLRHDGLLHEIIEGRMKGKPTRGRRRIQMLHDLANDDGYVALKRAAEDREGWSHREDVKNLLYSRRLLIMMMMMLLLLLLLLLHL